MYAIKHISGIIEFSTTDEYVEEGAICIDVPDGMYPKLNHFYDIQDRKLIDIDPELPLDIDAEETNDLG